MSPGLFAIKYATTLADCATRLVHGRNPGDALPCVAREHTQGLIVNCRGEVAWLHGFHRKAPHHAEAPNNGGGSELESSRSGAGGPF